MNAAAHESETEQPTPALGTVEKAAPRLGKLDVALVRDTSLIEAEWRRLENRDWNSLNQSLGWCRAWTDAQGRDLIALSGATGSRIRFLLPLEVVEGPLGRVARLPGGRFNNLNTGLFDELLAAADESEVRVFQTKLVEALRGVCDLILIDKVPLEWGGTKHPLAPLASIENQNHSFQLPLLGTMEATLFQVNARTRRRKFRVQVRRLNAIGGFDYVIAETPEQQHDLLERFFAQKAARLRSFRLPDVFAPAAIRDFFHRLLDGQGSNQDSSLVMHAIRLKGAHDGHIAAVTGLSRKSGHVLCQFSSIDESIGADASPGELLFWMAIEHSIRNCASMFDFGIGDQPYKRSWCSQETVLHDILLPVTVRGSLLAALHRTKTRMKTVVKRNRRLYTTVQQWRSHHTDNS